MFLGGIVILLILIIIIKFIYVVVKFIKLLIDAYLVFGFSDI